MTLRISGKNMDIGDALRTHVQGRVDAALAKYFDGAVNGHVTFEPEGSGYRSECVLHLATGVTLESIGAAQEAYAAFDQTATRIEKRLRRHKRRLNDRSSGNGRAPDILAASYSVIESPAYDEAAEEEETDGEFHPVVIHESTRSLLRLSVSEAVVELDLTGAPCMVFQHAGTGRVNIVYRRTDGAIGWVDPPADQP
ncbi:MAG: ribosome-associated translation inhibitor RaiA [Salinarimonadaceae bacterium]|nr:MAG: ribosome-associated translation inhibitor RaiA [Salinarimonadaceae bacterium]